jgi:RsiW-degrading membrane proteinase PrsW (M82 family)
MSGVPLPDPERTRRRVGLGLLLVSLAFGMGLLLFEVLLPPLLTADPGEHYLTMLLGAGFALPAAVVYLTVPRLLDRYDPEPWYALVGCLAWGGICATAFSIPINTCGSCITPGDDTFATVLVAPIVEEAWKGLGVFGVFYFLRREFDGIVDGIIYATFVALAFAAIENVLYYAKAASESSEMFAGTLFLRGVLGPWGHPLYTSMTGIGFGFARETERAWVRWAAPVLGYGAAVALHMLWNGGAVLASSLGEGGGMLFLILLPLWLLFVLVFLMIVVGLVLRRGAIIRAHLVDEVALGFVTRDELALVGSAFGVFRARLRWGPIGVELVRSVARLALSKWHTTRARRSHTDTVSYGFIVPLRQRIAALRARL